MKVALISPYGYDDLGIRHIHSYLNSKGIDTRMIFFKDWLHYYSFRQLITKIDYPTEKEFDKLIDLLKGYDFVGISVVSTLNNLVKDMTKRIKETGIKVIWGGSHAMVKPGECLETADYICLGEGEETMLKLAKGERLEKIPNLMYKKKNKIVTNSKCNLMDIDKLPNLDYSDKNKFVIDDKCATQERMDYSKSKRFDMINGIGKFDPMNKNYFITYMTSRGCPYHCDFCSNNIFKKLYKGYGNFLRRKSVNKVIEELKEIISHREKVEGIVFIDDLFLFDKEWLREFCEEYEKEINLPFVIEGHPNTINEEVIKSLSNIGMVGASIGIQHCKRIREELFNRFTTDEQIIRIHEIMLKYGVKPKYDFIVDIPGETEEDKQNLLKLILNLKRSFEINLFSMIHFPETDLTKKLLSNNLISDKEIEGKSTMGISFPNDLKIKQKREFYKVAILLYVHLGLSRKRINKLSKSKFWRNNSWRLLYLIDFTDMLKYSFYRVLKVLRLYSFVRKIYRRYRKWKIS